jgi:hypothetical protein
MPKAASRNGSAGEDELAGGAAVADTIGTWQKRLIREIRQRPARSLLIAVGTGYLAGGGLGTMLTARLLSLGARVGMRLAIIPLITDGLERAVFDGIGGGAPADAKNPNTKQLPHQKEMDT